MSTLVSHVHVYDDVDVPHIFGPDDDVPEWALSKMGAHCFEDGVHPHDAKSDTRAAGQEPSRNGKGSGIDAWVAFAEENGKTVTEGATRDQIIQGLIDAGVIDK